MSFLLLGNFHFNKLGETYVFLAVDSLHRKVKYFCSVNVWSAGFKIIFGQLAGHQISARFLARFRPVKMLRTSKSLVGIHKAANRDLFISILRIYNCKQLKYFFYDLIVNELMWMNLFFQLFI